MSRQPASVVRSISFGDLEAGVWGAAWWSQEPIAVVGVVGAAPLTLDAVTTLDGEDAAEEWRLKGRCVELTLAPAGDAADAVADEAAGFEQLCRVDGLFVVDGEERSVACLGRRSRRRQAFDAGRFESFREVSAWYEPDEAVVVSSLRPRRARGHEAAVISAVLLEPGTPPPVSDPRLSTTYTSAGAPARMTLELWLEGEDEAEHYPRRMAGEAVGTGAQVSLAGAELRAELLRCHSRGRAGVGVYLLIRSR
jgi:hypothetical protein